MGIESIVMFVASIVNQDEFVIFTFVCASVDGFAGTIQYNDNFEDYRFVQNEKLTTEGIAVHPYGAIIVPSNKMETVGVKELEIMHDGRSGKPDPGLETMLSGLEIGATVAFSFD